MTCNTSETAIQDLFSSGKQKYYIIYYVESKQYIVVLLETFNKNF